MKVKSLHPVAEKLARKLAGITTVPKKEQEKMVRRAVMYIQAEMQYMTNKKDGE